MTGRMTAANPVVPDSAVEKAVDAYHDHRERLVGYPSVEGTIRAALTAAAADLIAANTDDTKADAWDEGYKASDHALCYGSPCDSADCDVPDENPYRAAALRCECPPCPGRGNDGHGLTHCAECCYGTGVEADPACPIHGDPALRTDTTHKEADHERRSRP